MVERPIAIPYGPHVPPSTWPLDHIPGVILDIIIECLSEDAVESHTCDKGSECIFIPKPDGPIYTPLSPELKSMSLVDQAIRKVVLQKAILDTVVLYGADHIASTLSSLRQSSLRYIIQIVFSGSTSPHRTKAANRLRKQFMDACPTLACVIDETQEIAYMDHSFSQSLHILILELKAGPPWRPTLTPIRAPALTRLVIATASGTTAVSDDNLEGAHYPAKVQALCGKISLLELLNLQLPGLCVPLGYERASRLPQGFSLKDMLPKTLASITILHLDVSFCTVDKGSRYESHWYGYFRWLFQTTPKIKHLLIKMNWDESYVGLSGRDRTPRAVLDAMGLTAVYYDDARDPKSHSVEGDFTISMDMREFLSVLLQVRDDLESITIHYDVTRRGQPPKAYRILYATKKEGPKRGQGKICYNDTIDYEVVDAVIAARP